MKNGVADYRLRDRDPGERHVSRDEIRELDRRAVEEMGIPVYDLMDRAGRATADEAAGLLGSGDGVVVVCGKGNNGGDGFVAARELRERGFAVRLMLVGFDRDAISGTDHLWNHFDRAGVPLTDRIDGELVVDALLGTGLSREVRGPACGAIDEMNRHGRVLSIDIPSGLDADSGRPLGEAVRAIRTVTMGFPKKGFLSSEADRHTGCIRVAEIGLPGEGGR